MPTEKQSIDESCRQPAGMFMPVVDRNRCEGKADCVTVCPKEVFTIGILAKAERGKLSLAGKLKGFVHGWKQAFTPNAAACEACGLCITSCPEKAIEMQRV